jgi:hypothetical protein|nr:MAG TPA: hypothetical protein [Bacteriophage sp.]
MSDKESLESILNGFDSLLLKDVEKELYCDRMTFQELREWQKNIQEINIRLHKLL